MIIIHNIFKEALAIEKIDHDIVKIAQKIKNQNVN